MNSTIIEKPILTPIGIIKSKRVVTSVVNDIIYLNGLQNNDIGDILNILYIFEALVYRWDNEIETAQKENIDLNYVTENNYKNYMELLKYFNIWNNKTKALLKELSNYFISESNLMKQKYPNENDIYDIQTIRSADCFLLFEIFKTLNKNEVKDLSNTTQEALKIFYCIDEYEDDLHSIEKDKLNNEFNTFVMLENILGGYKEANIAFRKKINELLKTLFNYLSNMTYKEKFRIILVILNYNYKPKVFHKFWIFILTILPNYFCKKYLKWHFNNYHNKYIKNKI